MSILALDLGTRAGFALRWQSEAIESGVADFSPGGHEGEGARFVKFRAWLHDVKRRAETRGEPLSTIYYERKDFVIPSQVIATRISFGLWAHLVAWAEHHQIPYSGISVSTIKARFCGNGHAKKPAIIAECRRRGFEVLDHNHADALAILLMDEPAKARAA